MLPLLFEVEDIWDERTAQLTLHSVFIGIHFVKIHVLQAQTLITQNLPFSWTTLAKAPMIGLTFLQVGQNPEY